MSAHWIPNLRRDLPISVVLLLMAVAAVVPRVMAVIIAVAGFTGLMLFKLTAGTAAGQQHRDHGGNTPSETTNSRRGSHAACSA